MDQHYFYPLRIEQYDAEGTLRTVQVRLAERQNPSLPDGEGYTGPHTVYWDAPLDLLAYSVHDALLLHEWSEGEKMTFFTPEFMRRRWLQHRAKRQVLIDGPQEFHLRPRVLRGHFPTSVPSNSAAKPRRGSRRRTPPES